MIKRLGVIFSGLLILLLLSNISYNTSVHVFAQNNTNATESAGTVSPLSAASNATKLDGGVKINSPDKGDLVPLNSNQSLVINGVSKDNATSDCDVTIILNNVKPYQNVQPTGLQGSNDYSSWKYTLSSNYTSINEGSNKITSKIYCVNPGGQSSQAYYSVNVTATNFTQAQLSNYEMMLNSAANSTNSSGTSGNTTLASGVLQPAAQIQQFNQDTGSGPICCNVGGASTTTTPVGGVASATELGDDDTPVTTTDDEKADDNSNDDDSSRNDDNNDDSSNDDDSSRNDDNNDDSSNDDNDDNDDGGDIMDSVEDSIRDSGIDFSFD